MIPTAPAFETTVGSKPLSWRMMAAIRYGSSCRFAASAWIVSQLLSGNRISQKRGGIPDPPWRMNGLKRRCRTLFALNGSPA